MSSNSFGPGWVCPVRRWQTGRSDSWVTQEASVENKEDEKEDEGIEVGGGKGFSAAIKLV